MANFAVINNNVVVNTILADTKEIAEDASKSECVEYTYENPAGIGWTYDGTNFIAPEVVVPTE